MKGIKVVTAREMARVEALAIAAGASQEEFMRQAAARVFEAAVQYTERRHLPKQASLFAWKGNKSGDAFAAALSLLEEGFEVDCFHFASLEDCTPLCKRFAEQFRKQGGKRIEIDAPTPLPLEEGGLIIDGLLGTGFAGEAKGLLRFAIEAINRSKRPVLSIDVPSGLNGSTGEVGGIAVQADLTVALGFPKIGCFLKDGWNFAGELQVGAFGLPKEFEEEAEAVAYLPEESDLRELLPQPVRNRHKYQAGLVLGFAGSPHLTGAAKLASLAALRSGAGAVKLFYMPAAVAEMGDAAYEVIRLPWSETGWEEASASAKAVFLGPGVGRTEEARTILGRILEQLRLPAVIDADALQPWLDIPPRSICTPHRGEMLRLLGEPSLSEDLLLERCQRFCEEKQTALLLKGAPTWVFAPGQPPFLSIYGDPGMATAGSGDVLTGLLAALLAQGCEPQEAALLGAALHGLAGMAAAQAKTSHCVIASDLIEFLPEAFKRFVVHD